MRPACPADLLAIEQLYFPYSGRHINVPRITEALENYPSVVAYRDDVLLGFSYCFRFAPDIVELANIFVRNDTRSSGLGTEMLQFVLSRIIDPFRAIIAVNSDLYSTSEEKRRPDSFYLKNGFRIMASTGPSKVFWWSRADIHAES